MGQTEEAALKDKIWIYVIIWGKAFPSEENTEVQ